MKKKHNVVFGRLSIGNAVVTRQIWEIIAKDILVLAHLLKMTNVGNNAGTHFRQAYKIS